PGERRGHGVPRVLGDIRDDQVLPRGQANRAAAKALGDTGNAVHLRRGHLPDWQPHAAIHASGLLLRMEADVRSARERRARPALGKRPPRQRRRQAPFRLGEKPVETQAIEHVFEARAFAVGAVALVDEDAHDRYGHRHALLRRDDDAEVAGEIAVSGDATDRDTEVHAFRNALARCDANGVEADVVRVLKRGDRTAAVERDVELARQSVELAVVEYRVIKREPERPRVDELLRIDAGGRVAGDV